MTSTTARSSSSPQASATVNTSSSTEFSISRALDRLAELEPRRLERSRDLGDIALLADADFLAAAERDEEERDGGGERVASPRADPPRLADVSRAHRP
jgi:hypothetical protein